MNNKELIYTLNLEDFPNTYIQKVIGTPLQIYIVTYNSRFPSKFITNKKLKSTTVSTLYRIQSKIANKLKLTPAVLLQNFTSEVPTNALIYVRDIGAESLLTLRDINPTLIDMNPEESPFKIPVPGAGELTMDLLQTVIT